MARAAGGTLCTPAHVRPLLKYGTATQPLSPSTLTLAPGPAFPQFSVLRYESVIHEFDPYFNYRSTIKLVQEGVHEFWVRTD